MVMHTGVALNKGSIHDKTKGVDGLQVDHTVLEHVQLDAMHMGLLWTSRTCFSSDRSLSGMSTSSAEL